MELPGAQRMPMKSETNVFIQSLEANESLGTSTFIQETKAQKNIPALEKGNFPS